MLRGEVKEVADVCSHPQNLQHHHTIDRDGYNNGRDLLVEAAERGGKWKIWQWKATTEWVDGLLEQGRHGINHNISQDGRVAVLNVQRVVDVPLMLSLPLAAILGPVEGVRVALMHALSWLGSFIPL